MVTLADFNKTLRSAVDRAKIIEKSDPAGSIDVWIKIAEFALAFAKKQSDFTLRRMIEQRVEGIIQRVKRLRDELHLYAAPSPPSKKLEIQELPSPPKAPASSPVEPKMGGETISSRSAGGATNLQATLGQLRDDTPATKEGKSIQDWLMAIPDGFKEIPATPAPGAGASSPTPGQAGGKSPGANAELTPAQKYFKELADQANAEEKKTGTIIDPANDPFAKANIPTEVPPDKKVCFACGMIVNRDSKFCPYCGTT
ncbi:MAG: hypothetical protein RBG13Loki_3271 [Promethearchaeota archaeon CR_4]|nr:MAG: hypothetical protein RBG13Loki_3271 [Candidatus Lokiarchaeota archaeon CR_4]